MALELTGAQCAVRKNTIRSRSAIVANNIFIYSPVFGENNSTSLKNAVDSEGYFIVPPGMGEARGTSTTSMSNVGGSIRINDSPNTICTYVSVEQGKTVYTGNYFNNATGGWDFILKGYSESWSQDNVTLTFRLNWSNATTGSLQYYNIYGGKTTLFNCSGTFMARAGDYIKMLAFRDFDKSDILYILAKDNGTILEAKINMNVSGTDGEYYMNCQRFHTLEWDHATLGKNASGKLSRYEMSSVLSNQGIKLPW